MSVFVLFWLLYFFFVFLVSFGVLVVLLACVCVCVCLFGLEFGLVSKTSDSFLQATLAFFFEFSVWCIDATPALFKDCVCFLISCFFSLLHVLRARFVCAHLFASVCKFETKTLQIQIKMVKKK